MVKVTFSSTIGNYPNEDAQVIFRRVAQKYILDPIQIEDVEYVFLTAPEGEENRIIFEGLPSKGDIVDKDTNKKIRISASEHFPDYKPVFK